ncbi:MAG: class I SAM-dependent methyltransferase [Gemmatimonadota bacterium]
MSRQHSHGSYGEDPSKNYERFFVPAIGAPLAMELVREAELRPGARVLDVACGTGIVARLAADRVGTTGTVAGLDINPGMLKVAGSSSPPDGSIEWYEASADSMPLPDESFDAVLCQLSLQFFADQLAALREMLRVLEHGGRLTLSVPGPAGPVFDTLTDAMERHISPQAAGFVRQVFSLYDTTEIEGLIGGAGFRDVEAHGRTGTLRLPPAEEFLWQYVQSTPLSQEVSQADEEARKALECDVLPKWQPLEEDGVLMCPQRIVVANARR